MQRSELNSSGTRGVAGRLPLAFLALLVAVPASAQTDTVRVRTVSTWQKDVDHLRKELLEKRRMEFELVRQLNTLERRPKFAGFAIDPPPLGHFPKLVCALNAVRQADGSLKGPVTEMPVPLS